jgi:hypothetical protein
LEIVFSLSLYFVAAIAGTNTTPGTPGYDYHGQFTYCPLGTTIMMCKSVTMAHTSADPFTRALSVILSLQLNTFKAKETDAEE